MLGDVVHLNELSFGCNEHEFPQVNEEHVEKHKQLGNQEHHISGRHHLVPSVVDQQFGIAHRHPSGNQQHKVAYELKWNPSLNPDSFGKINGIAKRALKVVGAPKDEKGVEKQVE